MALSRRKLSPYFLLVLLLVLGWVSFRLASVFLNYILTGLFIAFITHPLYDRLHSRIKNSTGAALLMVLGMFILLFVPLAFITFELVGELANIIGFNFNAFESEIDSALRSLFSLVGYEVPPNWDVSLVLDLVNVWATGQLAQVGSAIPGILADGFIGGFVMLYILYYGYTDGHTLVENVRDMLPLQEAHRDLLLHEVGSVIQAVILGSVVTALIQAVLGGIGFALFGVSNVILWSVVMFVLSLLPIVGPPLIWLPAGLWLIVVEERTFDGVGLLVYSAIMVSSLDNIIRPKLIGERARVHPAVILVGVLGGISLFGFSGLILGPLALSIFVTILQVYRKEFAQQLTEPTSRI